MVVKLQNLDDLGVDIGVVLGEVAEETLGAAEESSFILFAVNDLRMLVRDRDVCETSRLTCLSMLWRLGIWATMFLSKMVWTRTWTVRCLPSMPKSLALT